MSLTGGLVFGKPGDSGDLLPLGDSIEDIVLLP